MEVVQYFFKEKLSCKTKGTFPNAKKKRPCVTTIIRGVPSTSHESMKNEGGSHQHSLNITASLRICLKLCPQPMKIPVSNARCTIGPAVGHRVAVSVGGGGIFPHDFNMAGGEALP